MMEIKLEDKALQHALKSLEIGCKDLTPAMRKIAGSLRTETDFNFEDEGNPAWIPSLAAQQRGGKTLQKTGNGSGLRGSISTQYDASHAMIGAEKEYAAIHQLGGRAGRNRALELPARPFLPVLPEGKLQPEAESAVIDTILRHLESAARR
ncbi:phage virion morphogenesis protein [Salmonella enterica subsp. enterica serovar Omuna]|nr:phage virion morphogenesis protein [Salmonella enterica subsp. enterica serovar Omuna]